MKKLIKNLILFLIITISANCGYCYTLTPNEIKEELNSKIDLELKDLLKNENCEYKFNIYGLPFNQIITNKNTKPKLEIISQNKNFNTNIYKRILVKDSNNNTIKSFPINIKVLVYKDVLVANEIIAYNQPINQKNTRIEKKEISKYLGRTYSTQISGIIAKRNYQKDAVIVSDFSKQKSLILKNSSINIVFKSNNMNIKIRGKALKEGSIGDTILVRSDKYNKIYNAKIMSENEVMVRI